MAVGKYLSVVPLAAVVLACAPATAVAAKTQTITFTSTAPSNATVGGPTYTVTATGGASPEPVVLAIDPASKSVCALSGSASGSSVSFQGAGTCTIDANQNGNSEYEVAPQKQQSFSVGKGSQTITFTSTAPTNATVGGPTYSVTATGGASGNLVTFTIDATSSSVCTISGATVSFTGVGTCTIDANQNGNSEYEVAPQKQQSFSVGKGSQTITFTSTAPTNATVGGPTYNVTATATSGLPVSFSSATPLVCAVSGSTVSFVGAGTCTIVANQSGNAEYGPAPQVQQLFPVAAAPAPSTPPSSPPAPIVQVKGVTVVGPTSAFKVIGASLSLSTYAITFTESVTGPGMFSWTLYFENGKFGVFAARAKKCKAGKIKLKGRCRPASVLFARGSEAVATAGNVTFTVRPTRAGVKALKKAFKHHKSLPVTAYITFQSSSGGAPTSRVQSLVVKGRR